MSNLALKLFACLSCILMMRSVSDAQILNVQFIGERAGSFGPSFNGNGFLRESRATFPEPTTAPQDATGTWNHLIVPAATPNTSGTYDNPIWPSTLGGLVDSFGSSSTLTLSLTNFTSSDKFNGFGFSGPTLFDGYLLEDSSLNSDNNQGLGTATVTIGGLNPDSQHDLYLYSSNAGVGSGGVFSVNGGPAQISTGGSYPGGIGNFSPSYSNGADYLAFMGVTANATGQIVISVNEFPSTSQPNGPFGHGILNGFQISAVPEPSSATLMCLAAIVVIGFRAIGFCRSVISGRAIDHKREQINLYRMAADSSDSPQLRNVGSTL